MVDIRRRLIDPQESTSEAPTREQVQTVGERRRRWPWIGAIVIVGAVAAAWFLAGNDESSEPSDVVVSPNTAEVVRTDLVSETSYDGTLGRADGESIPAGLSGTITASAIPGDTVGFGEELFWIDGEPVVLVEGDLPAWRTIGFAAESEPVANKATGTVTALVSEGDVIEQGDVIYELDGEPVVALYGATPAYRTLREDIEEDTDVQQLEAALLSLGYDPSEAMTIDGDFTSYTETLVQLWQEDLGADVDGVVGLGEVVFIAGPAVVTSVEVGIGDSVNAGQPLISVSATELEGDDVAQLESALADLGYDPGAVDSVFTLETHAAVMDWQTAIGADVDGAVDLGEVVFRPSPVRISTELASIGTTVQPASGVVTVTSENTVVTIELPAEDQGTLTVGMAVTVELPDGTEAQASVTSVASVATVSVDNTTVFEVEVLLDDPTVAAGLDEAPVDVLVATDSAENVVAVPVSSLLALAEGGYAVEVEDAPGVTRLIAVDPGFFADGFVEVTGADLEPGQVVVVP